MKPFCLFFFNTKANLQGFQQNVLQKKGFVLSLSEKHKEEAALLIP
jgi:hypothetical protein